jgi:hypothetical protein
MNDAEYPGSSVLRTPPPPQGARPVPRGRPVGHPWPRLGASRVAYAFLVYMLPPIPRCSGWEYPSLIPPSRISLPRNGSRVGLHIVLVESKRGAVAWSHAAMLRFLSPLIEPDMGAPIRLSDKTSGVRSRKAMSRRLQFDEPQGLVEVLVRKACSPCAANLMLRA